MTRFCSLIVACWLAGCGAEAAPKAAAAPAPIAVVPAAPEVTAVKVAVADPPEVAVVPDGFIGVEACDDYLNAYAGCVAGLREDDRAAHLEVIAQQRAAWIVARADTKLATTLADTCAASRAASEVALPDCKGW